LLNGLDRIAHVADRLRQAAGQAPGQQEGEQQGEQREDAGLEQDFLLALTEGIVGHADDHPAQIVVAGRSWLCLWKKSLSAAIRCRRIGAWNTST
jgi:hypothetical protein